MSEARAATRVLEHMWDGSLPVPVEEIIRDIRIAPPGGQKQASGQYAAVTLADETQAGLSGSCSFDRETGTYRVTVNRKDYPRRQRFTLAHELGHILYKHLDNSEQMYRADDFSSFASQGAGQEETEANRFAAQLLMPKTAVEHFARNTSLNIQEMADVFEVSSKAMRYRLMNLGLI